MIVGTADCAKTFLCEPLQKMFVTFSNPSNNKYAWIGSDNAEIIYLNDFWWSSEVFGWKELLLLLEGQIVHLPLPKNQFAADICNDTDVPVISTSSHLIKYVGRGGLANPVENEMMAVQWRVFDFHHTIPEAEQISVPPCKKCFSKLILNGEIA